MTKESFVWGAASSAYQTEGFSTLSGGGISVWDTFCHTPGRIAFDDNADIACDGFHRYREDLELLKATGATAYRFSTSWARIDPSGDGTWNTAGLAYYDRVVDCCLELGLTPYMTLHHWELPQALEDRGGWLTWHTSVAFERFAKMMAAHFKGRVRHYFTINEPQCIVKLGYLDGIHAPGKSLSQPELFECWKNLLFAHGLAQRRIKEQDPDALVGIASTGRLCYPEQEVPADIVAARQETFSVTDRDWLFTHQMLLDPIILGKFPDCRWTNLEKLIRAIPRSEMELIHCPPDMVGYNIYNGSAVRASLSGPQYTRRYPGFPRTALKWPITPEVLDWGLRFLYERYRIPGYITENGISCNDRIYLDGKVHDADRIDFLTRYFSAMDRAAEAGVDLRGYFHWSLTDNFEWHSGYSDRFGLVYIDYPTQRRIPKDSYYWYAEQIKART